MSEFDRIVREALVMGGQARIRDTNITVNEIVRLSQAGTSQADILAQYPQIEAEDVHQALGYGISRTISAISRYRFLVLEGITPIIAYGEMLTGKSKMPLESLPKSFKEEITHIVLQSGFSARIRNIALGVWAYANFTERSNEKDLNSVDTLIQSSIKEATELRSELELTTNYPTMDISIVTNPFLDRALAYLLAVGYRLTPSAKLIVECNDTKVTFRIFRTLIQPAKVFSVEHDDFQDAGMFETAELIIFQHGSELKVKQESDSVIFEFALPIVDEG